MLLPIITFSPASKSSYKRGDILGCKPIKPIPSFVGLPWHSFIRPSLCFHCSSTRLISGSPMAGLAKWKSRIHCKVLQLGTKYINSKWGKNPGHHTAGAIQPSTYPVLISESCSQDFKAVGNEPFPQRMTLISPNNTSKHYKRTTTTG